MYYKFLKYIEPISDKNFLLAVSGGRDSMALVNLFMKAEIKFAIAHFNHSTREGESDRDEFFVKDFCLRNNITCYTEKINIKYLSKTSTNKNFHDLARNERYKWLRKLKKLYNYDFIVTAHHLDDNIETFIFKILRGSGTLGLSGIQQKNKWVIRPLLHISRNEIDKFITENNIDNVEDSSNSKDIYTRNYIRHNILPQFENIFENYRERISVTIENIHRSNVILNFFSKEYFERFERKYHDVIEIDKIAFNENKLTVDLIYNYFFSFGFNYSQCTDIAKSMQKTGTEFVSPNYRIVIDRHKLILAKRKQNNSPVIEISTTGLFEIYDKILIISQNHISIKPIKNDKNLLIDKDKLDFPFTMRRWEPGDRFKPFGLKGRSQKVKKYLTDRKISKPEKEKTLVIEKNGEIIMILDFEIDYEYRITEKTEQVMVFEFVNRNNVYFDANSDS